MVNQNGKHTKYNQNTILVNKNSKSTFLSLMLIWILKTFWIGYMQQIFLWILCLILKLKKLNYLLISLKVEA